MIATKTEQDARSSQMGRATTLTNGALTTANFLPHPFLHTVTYDVLLEKTDVAYLARPQMNESLHPRYRPHYRRT